MAIDEDVLVSIREQLETESFVTVIVRQPNAMRNPRDELSFELQMQLRSTAINASEQAQGSYCLRA